MYLEIFSRISRYFAFFGEFHGISRKCLNFAGPRPHEISEALTVSLKKVHLQELKKMQRSRLGMWKGTICH